MKKHILSLAFLFAGCMASFGQTAYLEEIPVVRREVVKTADRRAQVRLALDLTDLDMKRQHSLRVVPVLVSADGTQEQELPAIVVNGRVRHRVMRRAEALEGIEAAPGAQVKVQRRNGTAQQVDYEASVPFRRWMAGGSLQLRGEVTGCAQCGEGNETAYTGGVFPVQEPAYWYPFVQPLEETVKRRSETRSARLQFRQDSHRIDPDFKENAAELDTVRQSIRLVRGNKDLTITGIYVTGYASPEGKYDYNMRLSERRAKAFTEYMQEDLKTVPENLYHVSWKGEDWDGLRAEVLRHPGLLKIEEVLAIIDSCGADRDACEEQLKAIEPKEVYERLLNEMYGAVRRNEYRVEYNVRHFDLEEGKRMIKTRPDLMSVSEIQRVADSYGKNSPEYVDCLLAGAKAYPEDVTAVNNAALALLDTDRAREAADLLRRSPADGALQNMLGVACARLGDTDGAREAFTRAADLGYAKAAENRDALNRYVELLAE